MSLELLLAEVAFASYLESDEVSAQIKDRTPLTKVDFFSIEGCEGVVGSNEDLLVVAFRGTDPKSLLDLMTDINIGQVRVNYGAVHLGAYTYFKKVETLLFDLIRDHHDNSQDIAACGHSLGGMIARIFCCEYDEIQSHKKSIKMLADFGCPNTGDAYFDAKLDSAVETSLHFVNNCDFFARKPSQRLARYLGLDYTSPRDVHYFSFTGRLITNPSKLFKFVDRLRGQLSSLYSHLKEWSFPTPAGLKKHSMYRNLQRMRRAFK